MTEARLIIEQFDPEFPKPGGIDTCIRGLVKFSPPGTVIRIVGVDTTGTKKIGRWTDAEVLGRTVSFMPVAALDHSQLDRRLPHSAIMTAGLLRYRSKVNIGDNEVVQTHRVNLGWIANNLFRNSTHVQFLHSSGVHDIGSGSQSFFKHARWLYRRLEHAVVRRASKTVVFSKEGAERLRKVSPAVEFSPTWFDPDQFFVTRSQRATSPRPILWAGRLEPSKNPELAIRLLVDAPPEYSLSFAGAGTAYEACRGLVAQLGIEDRVRFLGAIDKSDMGRCMRDHDLLLMTSLFEGFSRTIVEALACGLPVVTTQSAEPNRLVRSGLNGYRLPDKDPFRFSSVLDEIADISPTQCASSVDDLSATRIVPSVLALPRL